MLKAVVKMTNGMNNALLVASTVFAIAAFGQAPPPPPPAPQQAPQANQRPWSEEPTQNPADNSNRGVARISFMNGVVSVRRGDSGEAVAAALNAPMSATDRLETGEGSRAEIQFDALNMIRVGPMSEVRLSELLYHQYQIQIATGTTEFRVMRDNDAQIEISTPSIAVRPMKQGIYRVTVKADGSTEVTVRAGEAEIASPKGTEKLGSGKTMEARGSADNPEFQVTAAIAQDQWDKWNGLRDQDLEKSAASRGYVNPDINGTEELDANGRWVNDPAYGQVWVPTVDPGWAPYRVGRWAWIDYYGWTWVSADPWGWAPYHYGRWYMSGYGWAWWPGPLYGPYYWQPALVGFFGWGPGIGIGFGFGNVGWVALAPFERFNAWYGPGIYGHGFGAVNIARNVNVANIYRNARVSNGVTSMASNQFGRAGVNGSNYVRAGAGDLAHAGAVRGGMPITPSRESTHFSNASASSSAMAHSENSHFYSAHPSSAASSTNHVSFDQQRSAMTRSAASMSNASHAAGASPASSRSSNSGVNPSSSSGSESISRGRSSGTSNSGSSNSANGGWQHFSGPTTAGNSNERPSAGGSGSNGSVSRPGYSNGGSSVRINPSVVQRAPSSSGSSSRGSSTGGSRGSSGSRGGGGGRR